MTSSIQGSGSIPYAAMQAFGQLPPQEQQQLLAQLGTQGPSDAFATTTAQASAATATAGPQPSATATIPPPSSYPTDAVAGLSDPPAPSETVTNPDGSTATATWPVGTKQSAGAYVLQPDAADKGLKIFGPGANGPNDKARLMFQIQGDKVMDKNGKELWDMKTQGNFVLGDKTLVGVSLDRANNPTINVVNGNSRENYLFSDGGVSTASDEHGFDWLQQNLKGLQNIETVNVDPNLNVSFNELDKLGGKAWQVDSSKIKDTLKNAISAMNDAMQLNGVKLDADTLLKNVSSGDLSSFVSGLQSALQTAFAGKGVTFDFSALTQSANLQRPIDVKNFLEQLSTTITKGLSSAPAAVKNSVQMAKLDQIKSSAPADRTAALAFGSFSLDPGNTVLAAGYAPSIGSKAYANELWTNLVDSGALDAKTMGQISTAFENTVAGLPAAAAAPAAPDPSAAAAPAGGDPAAAAASANPDAGLPPPVQDPSAAASDPTASPTGDPNSYPTFSNQSQLLGGLFNQGQNLGPAMNAAGGAMSTYGQYQPQGQGAANFPTQGA